MTDPNESKWYELDAPWDTVGKAEARFMELGQSGEWLGLVDEVSHSTHATAEEAWDGMAAALRGYLEGLR